MKADEIRKNIAVGINALRLSLGLDQKDFGKMIGVSAGYISEIEANKKNCGMDTLLIILEKFNVNPSFLFYGKGSILYDPTFLEESLLMDDAYHKEIGDYNYQILCEMFKALKQVPMIRTKIVDNYDALRKNFKNLLESVGPEAKKEETRNQSESRSEYESSKPESRGKTAGSKNKEDRGKNKEKRS